ncbi:hypothetical protein MAR_004183 [Mya arenaria]|uniref:Uncharacterized protein n=1 Tax=Mya arenaria TaxID=6604 RepID=A0ABY7F014_MYAAR|nr:hypothetical protein MAR_004183 [Mya arenaria]
MFNEKKHPEEKNVWMDGKWLMNDCFIVYVRVNEEVRVDQQMTMTSIPSSKISVLPVNKMTQDNPKYTTEDGRDSRYIRKREEIGRNIKGNSQSQLWSLGSISL